MAEKRTGKYIYELEELLGVLKNEAWVAVAQDNLTRKMNVRVFRAYINGDNDEPSDELYYSSLKVEEMFQNTGDILEGIINDLTSINNRIDDLINTVNSMYQTLNNRITEEVNNLNKRIDQEIANLNKRIDQEITALTNKINQEVTTLNTKINNLKDTLNNTITTNVTNLNNKIDNSVAELNRKIEALRQELQGWILYGSSVPTNATLPAGRLYIQYF